MNEAAAEYYCDRVWISAVLPASCYSDDELRCAPWIIYREGVHSGRHARTISFVFFSLPLYAATDSCKQASSGFCFPPKHPVAVCFEFLLS
jgi:hypothetical protein